MTDLRRGRSMPRIFDREITVPKCQINIYGEANCDHEHARDLPRARTESWKGEPEELVAPSWTAQMSSDPRLGEQMYECSSCAALLTLEETKEHGCG